MELLIRVVNDDDRRALAWLRKHVGEVRVADAAKLFAARANVTGGHPRPYVSAVCRYLGVWPPTAPRAAAATNQDVAARHLARMRELLAQSAIASRTAIR